jgi:hypothetical protein
MERIQLALDILTEKKSMLTLDNSEYELIGPTRMAAIEVAASDFVNHLRRAQEVVAEETLKLADAAMERVRNFSRNT